jgi:hypothetical protein
VQANAARKEGPDDVDRDLDGAPGREQASGHEDTLLRERIGKEFAAQASSILRGHNLRPHGFPLSAREKEGEVLRKALGIAADPRVKALGGYTVQRGEIGIQDDLLAANHEDSRGVQQASGVHGDVFHRGLLGHATLARGKLTA